MGLFGQSKSADEKAKEKVNEICGKLRQESRGLDRQIRGIEREEQKTILQLKEAAKKNDKSSMKVLAKSLVHSRKQKSRLYASQAQINSIVLQMKTQLAQMKMVGCMQKSTDVMKSMQNLIKLPELSKAAQELSKEMTKLGIIDEMFEETIDAAIGDDDVDTIADEEVEKVLQELIQGKLKDLPILPSSSITNEKKKEKDLGGAAAAAPSDDEEEDDMTRRLEALKS